MNKMNKMNNIIESLVNVNEGMRGVSRKNSVIQYKISDNTFKLSKEKDTVGNT